MKRTVLKTKRLIGTISLALLLAFVEQTHTVYSQEATNKQESASSSNLEGGMIIPNLPTEASSLEGFAVDEWALIDHVKLDFNNDGAMDIVGILQCEFSGEDKYYLAYPRILFAASNSGKGSYKLNFQDINLVRNQHEGGIFGDPYAAITAEGNAFTISAYGGSAWRWSEAATFKYMDNDWYLVNEETSYSYGPIVTGYIKNNYESGMGFRGYNNDNFDYLETIWSDDEVFDTLEKADYDLSFTVELDSPPTLKKASQRWELAKDRLGVILPEKIFIAPNIEVKPEEIPKSIDPFGVTSIAYTDENYILYSFRSKNKTKKYLAAYNRQNNSSVVVVQTPQVEDGDYKDNFDSPQIFKDRLYYEERIYETVKTERRGIVREDLEHTASRLVSLKLDGRNAETIFEYTFFDKNKTSMDFLPYFNLGFEFVKDGIVINLFNGDKDMRYYFIKPDGSDPRFLGYERGTSIEWLGTRSLVGHINDSLKIHMNLDVKKGFIEGSYYYDKYGKEIKLDGYFHRGSFELREEGGTGRLYGLIQDDMIKGVWTDGTKVLPLVLGKEDTELPEIEKPGKDILKFEGFYDGNNATDSKSSNMKVVPVFDDLAYIEASAYAKAVQNVHMGAFSGLALFDKNGLNYQADEKIYDINETVVIRLTLDDKANLIMDTNNFNYNCGAAAYFDHVYTKKGEKTSLQ